MHLLAEDRDTQCLTNVLSLTYTTTEWENSAGITDVEISFINWIFELGIENRFRHDFVLNRIIHVTFALYSQTHNTASSVATPTRQFVTEMETGRVDRRRLPVGLPVGLGWD